MNKHVKRFLKIPSPQVLTNDQDKEEMPRAKTGKAIGLVMATKGKCWTSTRKRALEFTGFLANQGFKYMNNYSKSFCQNEIVSEICVLPITVLLVVVAYAVVAAVFYNNDV